MSADSGLERSLGLWGATGIGVGAIVGGGVLALAGVAFATTGPGAIVAFALNGVIALLTALSFAELAAAFPQSGGSYTFAKKTLSAEIAFMVGWVVWLASIVAAVLYALGFAAYTTFAAAHLMRAVGAVPPGWLEGRATVAGLAIVATAGYSVSLYRKAAGGGQWATVGKVVVFVLLILGGLWALVGESPGAVADRLTPFFPGGGLGLLQAMGYTFIALQGFDLIAAVGGEVRDPEKNIPRAMFLSLAAALAIYLPFLFVIATVGVAAGGSIVEASAADPATVVALAARTYLGAFGFWLVIVAALLAMVSALHANLFAASRVALSMARDRSLPHVLGDLDRQKGTPAAAILATALVVVLVILLVPNVAVAGAVSSLIFLLSFALAHAINILARQRGDESNWPFRVPWFPLAPSLGGLLCVGLAFFQGFAVPSAGLIAFLWLSLRVRALLLPVRPAGGGGRRLGRGARPGAGAAARPRPPGAGADRQARQRRRPGGGRQRVGPAARRPGAAALGGAAARHVGARRAGAAARRRRGDAGADHRAVARRGRDTRVADHRGARPLGRDLAGRPAAPLREPAAGTRGSVG